MRSCNLKRFSIPVLVALVFTIAVLFYHKSLFERDIVHGAQKWTKTAAEVHEDTKESTIHIAIVCGGFNSTKQLYTLIKSILFYRKENLRIHLLVDSIARKILQELFKTWIVSNLELTYYNISEYERQVSWIMSPHYSNRYGLMKLVFPSILAKVHAASKIIMLDTDMLALGDVGTIWKNSLLDDEQAVFALVENQSDWYLGNIGLSGDRRIWPATGRGYNSGLIVINLKKLLVIEWDNTWRQIADLELASSLYTTLADQDIFNAVFKANPGLVQTLPCHFNLQINDHTNLTKSCPEPTEFRLIHWNSPRKLLTKNPDAGCFFNWYRTFKNWSGKLLEADPCCRQSTEAVTTSTGKPQSSCDDFRPRSSDRLRTYLYLRDFEIDKLDNDVTLVVHLSSDRLPVFEQLVSHWYGPVSVAIYLPESETDTLERFIQGSEHLVNRKNIGYHLVFHDEGFNYPINRLRDIALEQAQTPYVFLSDVDFLPSYGLHEHLRRTLSSMHNGQDSNILKKRAIVIPAFENSEYRFEFPTSKMDLLTQFDLGIITAFRDQIWPRGQAPTDYRRWRSSTKLYKVEWEPEYEPFIVTSSDVLRFDEDFVGFGWNKVEHTTMLAATGYEFIVEPEAFLVHKFHPPSYDTIRHRESPKYKMCIRYLKKLFLLDLKAQYPNFFANFSGNNRRE